MQLQLAPKSFIEVAPVLPARRLASVDALRGFNIFWILGGDGAIWSLDQMSSGKGPITSSIGHFLGLQLNHAPWEGFRFYDFIFPLFIFITGVSIVLALPRLVEREELWPAHLRVLRRALLLYGLGLIYYGGISQHWADIRYLGVLQRIALCYLFASLMFLNLNLRGMMIAFASLLAGYWALMTFVPVPGIGAGSFAPDANLANWLDAHYLPGRLWDVTRDPEGMLSTLPAIGTCLLGVFAGMLLKNERLAPQLKSLWLIGAGIMTVAAGQLWGLQFPVIKAIWTSSFVLVAGGYSLILLGVWHQIIDVWGIRGWSTIFVWIGANAIMLYFFNNAFGFEPFALRFVGGDFSALIDSLAATPGTGRFLAHVVGLTFAITLAGFFYRRKIFLRV
jgi:predicted acyltransferase